MTPGASPSWLLHSLSLVPPAWLCSRWLDGPPQPPSCTPQCLGLSVIVTLCEVPLPLHSVCPGRAETGLQAHFLLQPRWAPRAGPWVGWGELCPWSCTEALVSAPGAPGGSRGCQRTGSSPGWQVPPGRDADHGPRGRMPVSEMWKEVSDHLLRLSPGSRDHLVCGHSLNEVTPLPVPCSFP